MNKKVIAVILGVGTWAVCTGVGHVINNVLMYLPNHFPHHH